MGWATRALSRLSSCTISGNSVSVGVGGGLDSNSGTAGTGATLTACTITGNSANDGGGVSNAFDALTLTGCTVSGNYGNYQGGGIDNYGSSTASLMDCTISGNSTSTASNTRAYGGGLANFGSTLMLADSTVSNNFSYADGGLSNKGQGASLPGKMTLSGCTISGNTAQGEFGAGPADWEPVVTVRPRSPDAQSATTPPPRL